MRIFALLFFLIALRSTLFAELALSDAQQVFQTELAAKVASLEKKNAAALAGDDGWLFLTSELRFLAQGRFWGDAAVKTSRAHKSEWSDPLPAILDFHRQLRERGIELLVVPIPPKGAIYPEKLGLRTSLPPSETAPALQEFYRELARRGIDCLDLSALFASHRDDPRGPIYCRTDSHWSGVGCALAGQAIAQRIREKVPPAAPLMAAVADWKEFDIAGDLAALTSAAAKPAPERIAVRQLTPPAQPDPDSPVLLIGDSHTLVFHDFLAEGAGLLDQLASELRFAPDLIGTRGSGATPVRVSLYRRSRTDPDFLAKKKMVVWCFAAREFTEADQGWVVQPIAK